MPATRKTLDPGLRDYCQTDRQRQLFDAVVAAGGITDGAAKVGMATTNACKTIKALEARAAAAGYAPGHWTDGVAPGYRMGKVTVQRGPNGVERVWERQHPEQEALEALVERCAERLADFPRLEPIRGPAPPSAPLTNFLGLFDLHIGEKISCDDPAGRWDIAIAKRTIVASAVHALAVAPKAQRLVLCFGGDALHYDGLLPVTPKSRHVLHSDGDFDEMADAAIDVALTVIDEGLRTHHEVHLIWAPGNHDESSARWMQRMLAHLYANEPRLTVVKSRYDYFALRFGKVMICVHHGHKAKLKRYAGIFANMFREMWGLTTYAYGHRGHEHHYEGKEQDGMVATQHPSLAPSDDFAMGLGLISRRGCLLVTYHDDYGEVARNTTRPEMLMAA